MPKQTLLEHIDRFPPFMCLAMSNKNGSRLSIRRLAEDSGLSLRTSHRISKLLSWNGVTIEKASAFAAACGVDLINHKEPLRTVRRAMKAAKIFPHLSQPEREEFCQLAKEKREQDSKTAKTE